MEPGIYIEIKPVTSHGEKVFDYKHAYLVYRKQDGTTEVIRGGLEFSGLNPEIEVETGKSLENSKDRLGEGEKQGSRLSRKLDIPPEKLSESWGKMRSNAEKIGISGLNYRADPFPQTQDQTSNSIVRSSLDAIGYPIDKAIPEKISKDDLPGINDNLKDEMEESRRKKKERDEAQEKVTDADRKPSGVLFDGSPEGASLYQPKGKSDEDAIEDDPPEVKKFMKDLTKPDRPIDEVLLKKPETWTGQEVKDVMAERNRRPGHDPEFDEIVDKERAWFSHFYGGGPAKTDETGRIIEPQPIVPIPNKPTKPKDADGSDLADSLKRLGNHVAGAAKADGLASTIKALQGGLNIINRERAKKERPSFSMLKEDGLFGTKTKSALKKTAAKHGAARAEEGLALGRFRDFARDSQKKNEAGGLGKFTARTMSPLFRDPKAGLSEGSPRVESSVLQETVNDLGSSHFGRDKWKPLKEDGWIGPKSEDAFGKVARAAGPEKITERFGGFLGFFD